MADPASYVPIALGASVPAFTPHAISVSLPTWDDNVGYEEGDKRVVDAMVSGYPRFFIHLSIRKLIGICVQKFGTPSTEDALLFPTRRIADACRTFMLARAPLEVPPVAVPLSEDRVHLVRFVIAPPPTSSSTEDAIELHIVLFPAPSFPLAKQFWQHTGLGISSRCAERALSFLASPSSSTSTPTPSTSGTNTPAPAGVENGLGLLGGTGMGTGKPMKKSGANRHYLARGTVPHAALSGCATPISPPIISPLVGEGEGGGDSEDMSADQAEYLEERYGRNLPREAAANAKRALRRRIAGVLVHDSSSSDMEDTVPTTARVSEDDVYLYPTGMSAIWSAHQLCLSLPKKKERKSVCFGFPYTDTLKILQKWGAGCIHLGGGLDADLDLLSSLLQNDNPDHDKKEEILALFTEFPSNPLLRCADLPRLRALADQYGFVVVVDETLGNFVNVDVMPYADIVVSSLSKVFSGDSNVMGGSLVLNPRSPFYDTLKNLMEEGEGCYEDTYFGEDATYMERNARSFLHRIPIIDSNALSICSLLSSPQYSSIIKCVYYPLYTTPSHYLTCKTPSGGYGGLFSVTFHSIKASKIFFDALECHKGPSLGTNFTLACPYTILGHYGELEWAEGWGVERGLVRVSVGMEGAEEVRGVFERALGAVWRGVEGEMGEEKEGRGREA